MCGFRCLSSNLTSRRLFNEGVAQHGGSTTYQECFCMDNNHIGGLTERAYDEFLFDVTFFVKLFAVLLLCFGIENSIIFALALHIQC